MAKSDKVGEEIMTSKYDNFDLFSLVESMLNEDEDVEEEGAGRKEEKKLTDDIKKAGLDAKPSKKTPGQLTSTKEEYEAGEDEEETNDSEEIETSDESPSTIDLRDAYSYDTLVKLLNQFRAAHSFSDKEISNELKKYFNKLIHEEKKVLHIFIKGLIQITLMDVKGKSAYSPSDLKFTIIKTGSVSSEKKKSLNKRIKAEKEGKEIDNQTPIKIGEAKQDKSKAYRILTANKNYYHT
jgi:hypothetical protein